VLYGMGAGALPTTSAVLADVLYQAKRIFHHIPSPPWMNWDKRKPVRPISQLITRYYLRVTVADQAGVLAQIARALGERQISIASVIQKEADEAAGTAEIVIMTHPSQEEAMQLALQEMTRLEVVREISNFVRVEA
ncbi:MAG: ACT domain-containing protein, partial [Chloroflexota bacterium]